MMDTNPEAVHTRFVERRSLQRFQVDLHLDDLQSEMEAGARALERMRTQASRVDRMMAAHLEHAGTLGTFSREIRTLRECMTQQRTALRELRTEMRKLRVQLSQNRDGG